ncbi:MAG TPA: hypothetical protein VJ870_20710 [Amycolatopsis sp.]|nr:hypothetical protein [Amycolatopsis sp.]
MVVHHGCIEHQDTEEVDELRVLKLDVALAEVLCRADRRSAMACGDQAVALQPEAERAEFRAWVEQRILNRPDPRGRRQALALLDLATGLAESPMESWMHLAVVDAGLPRPVPQFGITDVDGRAIYRLDLAWPDARIAGEYDGYEAHENRKTLDAARVEDLRRRGWLVIRATAADVKDPSRMIGELRSAFRQRGFRT